MLSFGMLFEWRASDTAGERRRQAGWRRNRFQQAGVCLLPGETRAAGFQNVPLPQVEDDRHVA
jgi:hypothetical protein